MKLIARNTDYTIQSLCLMLKMPGRIHTVHDISRKLAIRKPYLRKILQQMNKAGILSSRKGKRGGFFVTDDAKSLTLFDIIVKAQGGFSLTEHKINKRPCKRMLSCKLKRKLDMVEKKLIKDLKQIKLNGLF